MDSIFPRVVDWIDQYALWIYIGCGLGLLICGRIILAARRAKKRAIFKLEREVAVARESRAFSVAALLVGVLVAVTGLKFGIAPSIEVIPPTPTATPTSFIFEEPPTREIPPGTPTEPAPTATRISIRRTPVPPRPPTATPPPPVICTQPDVCIKSPTANARVSGVLQILGTANIAQFQFYKVEYGLSEEPAEWHSVSDIHRRPVADGLLDTWNTSGFPPGVYKLRLTVVDVTGNFGEPHEIRVVIGE